MPSMSTVETQPMPMTTPLRKSGGGASRFATRRAGVARFGGGESAAASG